MDKLQPCESTIVNLKKITKVINNLQNCMCNTMSENLNISPTYEYKHAWNKKTNSG